MYRDGSAIWSIHEHMLVGNAISPELSTLKHACATLIDGLGQVACSVWLPVSRDAAYEEYQQLQCYKCSKTNGKISLKFPCSSWRNWQSFWPSYWPNPSTSIAHTYHTVATTMLMTTGYETLLQVLENAAFREIWRKTWVNANLPVQCIVEAIKGPGRMSSGSSLATNWTYWFSCPV